MTDEIKKKNDFEVGFTEEEEEGFSGYREGRNRELIILDQHKINITDY